MSLIKNKEILIQNAVSLSDRKAREAVITALESALKFSDPYQLIMSKVKLFGSELIIGTEHIDLAQFEKLYIIGGGKASGAMAKALEELLEDYITSGIVNVLPGSSINYNTKKIVLNNAGHPLPDENGLKGARKMIELAERSNQKDLIICLISGGGSAMMTLPKDGVSLQDKQMVTKSLLLAGADIGELNTVRKHLSELKGGWLAKKTQPATLVSVILSDVVGDPLDTIASGPTAPDHTTYYDAIEVLQKFKLWESIPGSIRDILKKGMDGLLPETPKANDEAFSKVRNIIIGNNRGACIAAKEKLIELGFKAQFLTSYMEGEARQVGIFLSSIANEIVKSGNPLARPAVIIVGGETTVVVKGSGIGGRNQEVMLSAVKKIDGIEGVSLGSIGTDGIDGPTDAAGALIDGKTLTRAKNIKLDYKKSIEENDSNTFFSKLKDLVITGPTGSNVNDIAVICVI